MLLRACYLGQIVLVFFWTPYSPLLLPQQHPSICKIQAGVQPRVKAIFCLWGLPPAEEDSWMSAHRLKKVQEPKHHLQLSFYFWASFTISPPFICQLWYCCHHISISTYPLFMRHQALSLGGISWWSRSSHWFLSRPSY